MLTEDEINRCLHDARKMAPLANAVYRWADRWPGETADEYIERIAARVGGKNGEALTLDEHEALTRTYHADNEDWEPYDVAGTEPDRTIRQRTESWLVFPPAGTAEPERPLDREQAGQWFTEQQHRRFEA